MTRTPPPGRRRPFADADRLSGDSGNHRTYALLLVAAVADAAAFYQVVALLMSQQQSWTVWLLVAGFTVLSLGLTHIIGMTARRFVERHLPPAGLLAAITTLLWLFMGAGCFYVRVTHMSTGEAGGDSFDTPVADSSAQSVAAGHDVGGALLFLGLFLAGGLIAGATSYLSHNPVAESYARALRGHAEARGEVERLAPRQVRATHRYEQELAERERDRRRWESATAERLAWAEELKHYARHLMAAHLGDPAATDGLTDSGARLVKPSPAGPGLHSAPPPEKAA
ncbi:hypothetical protein PV396_26570 [Streptomyces sp. ME02-8801-2C]|uniref:hypothetical protein n=1 Tax=Streptomyces sp. ME02-8801-2C TaxID=3028680 RepID=UPI0029B0AC3F|nr:hypothetical protein [Streptomyces sp. ME02-8801-2C]MDX3455457.1 hypothetical protein [Streptomyces sp. ME02-8801-2C]